MLATGQEIASQLTPTVELFLDQAMSRFPVILFGLFLLPALRLAAEDSIKVGMFASLTGREASFGQTNHRGADRRRQRRGKRTRMGRELRVES